MAAPITVRAPNLRVRNRDAEVAPLYACPVTGQRFHDESTPVGEGKRRWWHRWSRRESDSESTASRSPASTRQVADTPTSVLAAPLRTVPAAMNDAEFDARMALNEARKAALDRRPTALYRLFDAAGELLYIGISADPEKRFRNHRHGNKREKPKEWWPRVASERIEWFDSRPEADTAETYAILTEHPQHNKAKTQPECGRRFRHRWLEERLADRTRPGHGEGADVWRSWTTLTAEIEGHEVPHEYWWTPVPPSCPRLVARWHETAVRLGLTPERAAEHPLHVSELTRSTRHHRGECALCGEPYPCDWVRAIAARYADHPQYRPLWDTPSKPRSPRTAQRPGGAGDNGRTSTRRDG